MSNPVEIKRLVAEIYRVRAAKMEMDFKIAEREAEIVRLKENMVNQDNHIEKVKDQLAAMGIDPNGI